ncbi:MAG: T9SS type A sorting domain-containing protein [Sphingomonadales bacterium]
MKKKLFVTTICFLHSVVFAQNWQSFTDSISTLSSPRACDLNNDGIKDVVFGGGTDGVYSNNGIMAYNGANGALLWKRPARNEVFGSAIFKDITNDGIKDVFIVGRQAQLLAINGSNGQLIWDYFPYNVNPADSGLYNFYNPQFIADVSGDGVQDILVANGGDHAAPVWDTTRPPGHLMVVNSMNGQLLAKAVVPDSAETYCSALVADVQGNGTQWVLYGTGGETLGGSFWACPLSALLNNTLAPSIVLMTDPQLGFVAPASLIKNASGQYDIIIQSYGGKVSKIKAANWSTVWSYDLPNTESSAEPVIGNFTGNFAPDVFLSLAKGTSSSYTDYYQVLLDGESGQEVFKDSIGLLQFASGNAIDLNNDGRDEAILSVNYMQSGAWKHRLEVFDFVAHTIQPLVGQQTGVNIGSTPLFTNLDNDNLLDLVYVVKKDSLNPMGWKGVYLNRVELSSVFPNAGLAWGSYLSTQNNGVYFNQTTNCGPGSILSNVAVTQPWCNGSSSGAIIPVASLGTAPYTFLWSNGSTAPQLQNVPAGTYTLQVTDNAGCYEIYTTTLVDPFVITFGGVVAPTCPGGSNGQAVVNSSGCPCMFNTCQFLWDNGVSGKTNLSATEGWNTVTITHTNGCVVVDSVFVPFAAPVVNSATLQMVTCNGAANGSIDLDVSLAFAPQTFDWSNGVGQAYNANLSPGTYDVTVTDARPCTATYAYVITEPDLLVSNYNVQSVSCSGLTDGQVNATATGGNGGYTYQIGSLVNTSGQFNNLSAGTYVLMVNDSLGCVASNQSIQIAEPLALTLTLNATLASGAGSQDGTASAAVSGGVSPYQYAWSGPNTQSDSMAVYLDGGWYTVLVTDANGCSISDSVFVDVLGLNNATVTNLEVYPNPSTGLFKLNLAVVQLKVFDLQGRHITHFNDAQEIDLSHLASGTYQLVCTTDKRTQILRVVKQ